MFFINGSNNPVKDSNQVKNLRFKQVNDESKILGSIYCANKVIE